MIRGCIKRRSRQERGLGPAAETRRRGLLLLFALVALLSGTMVPGAAAAKKEKPAKTDPASSALDQYLTRVHAQNLSAPASLGSTWSDTGRLARLMSDVRAFQAHDLISVVVSESVVSTTNGSITGARASAASSQLTSLLGAFSAHSAAANLLNQTSSNKLTGTAQAADNNTLTTTLGGTVVEVLPNGVMVIEAARQVRQQRRDSELAEVPVVLPAGCWDVLLADPPWPMAGRRGSGRSVVNHYPTMSIDQIAAMQGDVHITRPAGDRVGRKPWSLRWLTAWR